MTSSKKGQLQDLAFLGISLFALAIIIVVLGGVFEDINDIWQGNDQFTNQSKEIVESYAGGKYQSQWDFAFAFLLIGSIIGGVVGLFLLDTHPILFVMSIIAIVCILVVMALLANSYSDISETGEFSTWLDDYPIIQFIMSYFLETMIVISGIFALAIFAKVRS